MKGALSPNKTYLFDETGALVANEGESEESRSTRESIVLYIEGHSANHPADVAASNGEEIAPEVESIPGTRIIQDPIPETEEEVEEAEMEEVEESGHTGRRGRRGR